MKKYYLIEKYNLFTLVLSIVFMGRRSFHVVDSIEFFPNNSPTNNIFMRIATTLFGEDHIKKVPVYKDDYEKFSNFLWSVNKDALLFLDDCNERLINSKFGKYLFGTTKDSNFSIALKKTSYERVSEKALLYRSYEQFYQYDPNLIKVIGINSDELGIGKFLEVEISNKHNSKLVSVTSVFKKVSAAIIYGVFAPYLLREILRKGVTLKRIEPKKFELAIHLSNGLPEDEKVASSTWNDATVMEKSPFDPESCLFVLSRWRFNQKRVEAFKHYINKIGANFIDEQSLPIPFSMVFSSYLKAYFHGLKTVFSLVNQGTSEYWMFKDSQKIICSFLDHEVFCRHYKVNYFFSRDDYSEEHITRTIVQNKHGLKNVGLSHSSFVYPEYVPQSAHVYFDDYYVTGIEFEKLWHPYWSTNKSISSVGAPRDISVTNAMDNPELRSKFKDKYGDSITILMLITAHSDTISPIWLLQEKYREVFKILEIDPKFHLILRPRNQDAVDSFLGICPELKDYIKAGRCTVELDAMTNQRLVQFDGFSTQELMAFVDILISEDASSSLLEALCRDELFSFFFMIRYGKFHYQEDIVVYNTDQLQEMLKSYLEKGELYSKANQARAFLKEKFYTTPPGETWERVSKTLS